MSFIAAAIGGSALVGAYSANKASKAQVGAANNDLELRRGIYEDTTRQFKPYRKAGNNALRTYQRHLGNGYKKSKGYDKRMQGGVDAITAAGSVTGGLNSGSTLKRLTEYGQEFAQNDYDNWLNRIGGLMSNGQNAAGQHAAAGQNFANGAGQAYGNIGNANAAGAIGVNNALQGGLENGLQLWQYQNSLAQPSAPQTSMILPKNPYYG